LASDTAGSHSATPPLELLELDELLDELLELLLDEVELEEELLVLLLEEELLELLETWSPPHAVSIRVAITMGRCRVMGTPKVFLWFGREHAIAKSGNNLSWVTNPL